jgi:hypothetical protein
LSLNAGLSIELTAVEILYSGIFSLKDRVSELTMSRKIPARDIFIG